MFRITCRVLAVLWFCASLGGAVSSNGFCADLAAGDDFIDTGGSSTFFDPLDNDAVYGLRTLDPLSFKILDTPRHGEVSAEVTARGVEVAYFRNEPGPDAVRYKICATNGACDSAMLWLLEGVIGPLVSGHADRREPVALSAASLSGDVFIFIHDLFPRGVVKSVRFLLNGDPRSTERKPPYDLAGGTELLANPLHSSNFRDGLLSVTAEIKFSEVAGGHVERIETLATVANTPFLAFSYSKNRSSAGILDGAFFGGDVFVFLGILPLNKGIGPVPWNGKSVVGVDFLMDGRPVRKERYAPYDLGGGSAGEAGAFDMSTLSRGMHELQAVVFFDTGRELIVKAKFEVIG